MTDNKTIQEALAEVQRKVNEERAAKTKADWENIQELASGSSGSGAPPKPKEPFFKPGAAKNLAKGLATDIAAPLAGGAAIGTAVGLGAKKLATGTEFGRDVGKWSGKVLKGLGGADKPVIQSMVRGREAVADKLGEIPLVGQSLKSGYQSMYKDSKFNTATNTPEQPKQDAPKQEVPKPAETPKPETPPAGSSAAKMSFNQAYAKAREAAKTAGKDPNIAQFKFDRGGGEKTYQAAATKQDYVPMSKQFKVDIGSSKQAETPKAETPSVASAPKTDTFSKTDKPFGPPTDKFTKPESESGGKRKKMSEEHINELSPFERTFAQKMKQLGPGKTYRDPTTGKDILLKYADNKPHTGGSHAPAKPSTNVPLPPKRPADLNKPQSGISPAPTTWRDPAKIDYSKNNLGKPETLPSTVRGSAADPARDAARDTGITGKPSGETGVTSRDGSVHALQGKNVTVPTMNRNPEYESGGKKKKMSEDTNPLIASFLALQAKNPSNMFEAAKKLSKKQDEKLDVVDDDKIDAKDLAALRAGKKHVDEANIDPVVTGSSSVTKDPKKYVDPSTPTVPMSQLSKPGNAAVDVLDKAKGALDKKGVREEAEEVTFSQAEIDHINSFFLEASVAPTRPEVARGADSTSDKMSQNDVTGTSTESGGKKKAWKEEVELDEVKTMSPSGAHYPWMNKPKVTADTAKKSQDYYAWAKAEREKNDAAKKKPVKEETLEEGRPKKNPTPETTERDPRKHIQVEAGRAAAGNVVDFTHNDGSKSKITPAMGRRITSHLNGLKPADRQTAVNRMHDSAEGLKV